MAAGGLTTAEIGSRLSLPTARVNAYLKAAWARLAGGVAPAAGDRSGRDRGHDRRRHHGGRPTAGGVRPVAGAVRQAGRHEPPHDRALGIGRLEDRPEASAADRLAFLAEVRDLGTATFGADGFGRFVGSRQPLLEGRRVVDVLEGEQRGEVLDLLRGIAGGGPA